MGKQPDVIVAALQAQVRDGVDASTRRRAEYSPDAPNYRVVLKVVVFPRHVDAVVAVAEVGRRLGAPLTMRGVGTLTDGNAVGPGIVADTSRHLHRILDLDPGTRTAVVEPGVILDDLQHWVQPHGLRFDPDPSTHARCTIGGMIGNNVCGAHAMSCGTTAGNVTAVDLLYSRWEDRLADGLPQDPPARAAADRPGGPRPEALRARPPRASNGDLREAGVMAGYHTRWVRPEEPADDPERMAIREALAFGKALYDVRNALGLTVSELAGRADMTDDDIECIEEGGTEPTIPLLRRLAAALNADVRLTAGHDLGSVWFETHAA